MTPETPASERFEPRATRAMASMFDVVSGRYDLLNQLMTLGQDSAWRRAMWHAVPESARTVLDLCTGNGVSLPGLRRPGRLLLGIDVSIGMLETADETLDPGGWAPRLVNADAFRLPLTDASIDAVTVAFGVRNLRPQAQALDEIARVLRPGGTLVVLEATGPAPGPIAPLHRFHLRHVVPLLGRLSPDPTAYQYLSASILDFGDGSAFERALENAGFRAPRRTRFLMGATTLWVSERGPGRGEKPAGRRTSLQFAAPDGPATGELAHCREGLGQEFRFWMVAQTTVSAALTAALLYGQWVFFNLRSDLPLEGWQEAVGWVLLVVGALGFGVRTLVLAGQLRSPGTPP